MRRKPFQPGRRIKTTNGYIMVRLGRGRAGLVYEHRHVWEQEHGPIPDGFHVHHKNGIKDDNRLENLELKDGRRHVAEHSLEKHRQGVIDNRGPKSGRWRHDVDSAYITRRVAEGASLNQISIEMGVSWPTVKRHYEEARITRRSPQRKAEHQGSNQPRTPRKNRSQQTS